MKLSSYMRKVNVSGRQIPVYPGLPDCRCSQYARMSAEDMFGLRYHPADAWNFRYKNPVVWSLDTAQSKDEWKDIVKPGDILGIFYPASLNNTSACGKRDILGNQRLYTHMVLYAGEGIIIHQFDHALFKSDLNRFLKADFKLIEVMAPPQN